mgnify:CR=1 FL=1
MNLFKIVDYYQVEKDLKLEAEDELAVAMHLKTEVNENKELFRMVKQL